MKQEKKTQDAIYEVTIPLPSLPTNRLDTRYLVDKGFVVSNNSGSIKSSLGWVKGAKADRAETAAGSVPAVSVQFCLFSSHAAAVAVATAVEMGSANYPAHLVGEVTQDAIMVRGVTLFVEGVAPQATVDPDDIVTVRRL